jgi:hypothetical protein
MPCCFAYHNVAVTVTTGVVGTMPLNSERYDYSTAMHDTATNNSRITIPLAGVYHIGAFGDWGASAVGQRQVRILLNGTTILAISGVIASAAVTVHSAALDYAFVAGDYIELNVFQDSGGNLNFGGTNVYECGLYAHWVSA